MSERILYGYFRSSAAYRVRIALNLKELAYRQQAVNLRAGEQLEVMFQEMNPQGLVPVLLDGDLALTQSLAICEYLDEAYPETPRLLPGDAVHRARARAIAQLIACDIHPLNNLRVLSYLDDALGVDKTEQGAWYRHWVATGFDALERLLPEEGGFCLRGDRPTLADICLVPQVFNAKRFNVPMEVYPNITRINDMLEKLPAFAKAHPAQQPDFL